MFESVLYAFGAYLILCKKLSLILEFLKSVFAESTCDLFR